MRIKTVTALASLVIGYAMCVPVDDYVGGSGKDVGEMAASARAAQIEKATAHTIQLIEKRSNENENENSSGGGDEDERNNDEIDMDDLDAASNDLSETDILSQPGEQPPADVARPSEQTGSQLPRPRVNPDERSGLDPETLKEMEEIGLMFNIIWLVQSGERDVPLLTRILSRRFTYDMEPIRRFSQTYINFVDRKLEEERRRAESGREESDEEEDSGVEAEGEGGSGLERIGEVGLGQTARSRRTFSMERLRMIWERLGQAPTEGINSEIADGDDEVEADDDDDDDDDDGRYNS